MHRVYESIGPLGTQCLVDDMEAVQRAYDLCNRYGMDSISTGAVISFAMEAYEKGLITQADTGGIDLKWGNTEAMLQMTQEIGMRQGFGQVLGDGVKIVAEHVGGIAMEYAIHVKGLSLPAHDPRHKNGIALEYATANRGACHTTAVMASVSPETSVPDLGISGINNFDIEGTGTIVAKMQNFMCLVDSLVCCKYLTVPVATRLPEHCYVQPSYFLEWLNCVTGWNLDVREFLRCGERIFNLQRMINVRRGISRKDDTLPPRILTHKRPGDATGGNLPPLGPMLNEYYSYRGWTEEGIPSKEKLIELDLA
jgi:aldehyde:ferredoxin oxidoreductase